MGSRLRMLGRVAGVATLAVLLTGCLKLTQDLTLNSDDTVDGEVTLAVSKELLELSGQSEDDALASLTEGEAPLPEGVEAEVEAYDDGDFVGRTFVFSGASIERFSGESDGDLSIVRNGDTFEVSGALDLTSGDAGVDLDDPTAQQLLESFEVRISVTFPGEVQSSNGEVDGNTVTWEPSFGEVAEIAAVGSAIDSGGGSTLLWLVLGAVVVLVVILLVVVLGRQKGGGAAASVDVGFSPPGEGAAAAGAVGGPPAPVRPPATPTPVAVPEQEAPPMPSDTAGPEPPHEVSAPLEPSTVVESTEPSVETPAAEPPVEAPAPETPAAEPPAPAVDVPDPGDAGGSDAGGSSGSG